MYIVSMSVINKSKRNIEKDKEQEMGIHPLPQLDLNWLNTVSQHTN